MNSTVSLDQGARLLRDEELDAVSGGCPLIDIAIGVALGTISMVMGGDAVDGFVANAVRGAKSTGKV